MKTLITGVHGTVAPALAEHLATIGHLTTPWDRSVVPIDQLPAIREFIRRTRPDWFFHIALGSPDWAEMVARVCAEEKIKFFFTSSVSVFSSGQQGPFTVDVLPGATDDYGRYKIECERRVRAANPDALVARLGWQIGTAAGSNNMVDYLTRTAATQGRIEASRAWYPACAFLQDTAESMTRLMKSYPAGLYHLDGNPGLSFHEIVTNLNRLRGNPWTVVPCDSPVQNNRMIDHRIQMNPITREFDPGTSRPTARKPS